MKYPSVLSQLISALKALPGVGPKTAERYAFQILSWSDSQVEELSDRIGTLKQKICSCEQCGCLIDVAPCSFCDPDKRQSDIICVVSSPKDIFSLESTGLYRGLYHVLGGLLSPLDGRGPNSLSIEKLKCRLAQLELTEVVLALDATVDGDATALYLKQELCAPSYRISRLALGLPLGSPLEYIDGGTLARAFKGRA